MKKDQLEKMNMALTDAGCSEEAIEKAQRLLTSGDTEELVRHLRVCRCALMDDLHLYQRRVDRMDLLIRQTREMNEE